MPEVKTERGRVTLPGLCWTRKPGTDYRCCRRPLHDGDHHHYYGGGQWPQRAGETQSS
ncbi:hypothetical protein [Streptomyces formicae]